jgi:hypothetical protein
VSWTEIVVTVLPERLWSMAIPMGTIAARITQDTRCFALAAKLEGLRHGVS